MLLAWAEETVQINTLRGHRGSVQTHQLAFLVKSDLIADSHTTSFSYSIPVAAGSCAIHHMAKSMWTPEHYSCDVLTASTLKVSVFTPGFMDLLPFSHMSISAVQHWCVNLALSLLVHPHYGLGDSQRCWTGLRSELCGGQSSSSTPNCEKQFFF